LVLIFSAAVVAAALLWGVVQIVRELRATREEHIHGRALPIVQLFAPAIAAAQDDPRALLVWQPLARSIRQLYPVESAAVDRAAGGAFPFGREMMAAAHARWTADWLSWERTHDAEYKLKVAMVEDELAATGGSAAGRARLDAVEREKLAVYQRRYEEYVRVAKALQALATTSTASAAATTVSAMAPAVTTPSAIPPPATARPPVP
jgi:hypothetical protein